ncbi:unnamed protein product [Malus baccata var. baccata]
MAMATTILSLTHLSLPPHRCHHYLPNLTTVPTRVRLGLRTQALGNDMLGDFGARDPFPAEIASGFGEKVLGSGNTEHKILIPNLSALSLSQLDCSPVSPLQPPMSEDDAKELLRKVVGWRLIVGEGGLKLQCLWKLRDYQCGVELINKIYKVVDSAGHFPNLHLEQPNQVRAELWTSSIGKTSYYNVSTFFNTSDILN